MRAFISLPFSMKFSAPAIINSWFYFRSIRRHLVFLLSGCRGKINHELILINYLPGNHYLLPRFLKHFPGIKIVFDYVDDYASFPGAFPGRVHQDEIKTAVYSHRISVSSKSLLPKFKDFGYKTVLNENVADFELFRTAALPQTRLNSLLEKILSVSKYRTVCIYAGAINFKVNTALVLKLVTRLPDIFFFFIGPDNFGILRHFRAQIGQVPRNFCLHSPVNTDRLPEFFKGARIGIIPFQRNEHTDAVFPLKFFEYMAAGLAVVTTDLPSLAEYSSLIEFCSTEDRFIESVSRLHRENCSNDPVTRELSKERQKQRVDAAREHTWERRIRNLTEFPDHHDQ